MRTNLDGRDDEPEETPERAAGLFDRRDRQRLRGYVSFVWGSARRHRTLFAAVFVSIMGATVASFFVLPKTYHVETKALAQPTSALTVRGDGPSADSLTRAAADTVLREENLRELIRETDLLEYTRDHRAPAQRAKDAVVRMFRRHDESEADRLDDLVKRLENKLVVWTSDGANSAGGSTVTIAIDWPDAAMACRLVDAAQRAFLAARYAREVTALSESIEILTKHAAIMKTDVDEAVEAIEHMRPGDAPKGAAPAPASPARPRVVLAQRPVAPHATRPDAAPGPASPEIQAKQHAIDELEDLRRRQLSELQARLTEARATFTENHPTIVDLKQSIAGLSVESAQVTKLRQEMSALRAAHDAAAAEAGTETAPAPPIAWVPAPSGAGTPAAAAPPQLPGDVLRIALDLREDRDPAMVYARGRLRDAMDKYAALRAQVQASQIDLETAKAAFKYRYTVVTPARLPRSPSVPNIPVVTLVAFVVSILCGFLLTVLLDLRRGRLVERWQLERLLERPILGELALPDSLADG